MLWPVLGGDDGLSPAASPTPAATGAAPVKGVNKLTPLLLCAPCKPSGHRKSQSSTQWYVQQVKRQTQARRMMVYVRRFIVASVCFVPLLFQFLPSAENSRSRSRSLNERELVSARRAIAGDLARDYDTITRIVRDKIDLIVRRLLT